MVDLKRKTGLSPVQLDRYAKVMVWALEEARRNSGPGGIYTPGDIVILRYDPPASHLAERVYRELLQKELHVALKPSPHFQMDAIFFNNAEEDQLQFLGSWNKNLFNRANGYIVLRGIESLTHLKDCDPKKMALSSLAFKPLWKIRSQRENKGLFAWTLCDVPTKACAKQAKMTLQEYADQVAKACYLDEEDPVGRWQRSMRQMDRIRSWLTEMPIESVHVKSEDGETNLWVWIGEQRRWLGGSGHNIPSFEIFVSPEAGRAEGTYHANEPSFKNGRYVKDVRLTFSNGKVIKATAEKEQEFLRSRVNLDKGSRLIGEFSLTDRRFSEITKFMASTLFDENVGGENGNCHIAIGKAYQDSYSGDLEKLTPKRVKELKFSESAEHWDLVTTTPRTVTAHLKDGSSTVIYRNGEFTLPL